jgi:competence protein ComEC
VLKYFFLIFIFALIIFRYLALRPDYKDGQKIRITSKVLSEPIRYETAQYLKLAGLKIYLPKYPEIFYGDEVVVEGVVDDDKLKDAKLVEIKKSKNFLYKTGNNLVSFYQRALPEPHSSLVAGVVLGSKAEIPSSFWDSLKLTGTTHVVVASGMNVTLVAGFLMTILILLIPRKKAVILALIGVWIYALISGFDAPIIRAAVMGSIAFGAVGLGRLNLAGRALILSALLMLIINPLWISDLGFILSFVATASLMLFESRIRGYIKFVPAVFREGLSTSLAAQI